ncbi:MAG: glycosyltransferase [Solobacterium sp.]|nr:glycosyltransferase [Solobacterium sp.]
MNRTEPCMYEPMITVIVPVYNSENTLPCCLDSLLNQTWRNLHIVVVDDGSTDQSGYIADDYGRTHERIHVIHQANGGVSAARNAGIEFSISNHADYIGFADSDDWMAPEMYESMILCAVKSGGGHY